MHWRVLLFSTLLLSAPLFADSIDDADAKSRGVPVAQVVAEHQLEIENRKIAQLEKQVADLKEQLASLKPAMDTSPAEGPAGALSAPNAPDAPPLHFDGPRESSALYDGFVKRYLAGDWATLAADMAAQQKQIDALPAGNVADLTYIERTLAECRPAWWDQLKQGKVKQIKPVIWKHAITVSVSDGPELKSKLVKGPSAMTFSLAFPFSDLDARDPLAQNEIGGGDIPPNLDFTTGDGISAGVWNALGGFDAISRLGLDKSLAAGKLVPELTRHYLAFWDNVVGNYFATPGVRRVSFFQDCVTLNPVYSDPDHVGQRNLGSLFVEEIVGHQDLYPQFHILHVNLKADEFPPQIGNGENFIAAGMLAATLLKTPFTLEQDRALRDAIKAFADANPDPTVEKLKLPNGQFVWLDPAQDARHVGERYEWLKEKMKGP